jgi:hypothetical protein
MNDRDFITNGRNSFFTRCLGIVTFNILLVLKFYYNLLIVNSQWNDSMRT